MQGLAFGGEFGGAVTFIAEHSPAEKRGFATSAVAITLACGLVLAILVVLACELILGKEAFEAWGWRIPFLLSAVLMLISIYIRRRLQESPLFLKMKLTGQGTKTPVREAFGQWRYLRIVLLLLSGAIAGQSVATATGAYPIYMLMLNLKIDPFLLHYTILGYSIFFVGFMIFAGWLSDHIGRLSRHGTCRLSGVSGDHPLCPLARTYKGPRLVPVHCRTEVDQDLIPCILETAGSPRSE